MEQIRADEKISSQRCTPASANFNARVLRKLQKAFAANPDTDLLSAFPTEYSARLDRMKKQEAGDKVSEASVIASVDTISDPAKQCYAIKHRTSELTPSIGSARVVFPLVESVQDLLRVHTHDISTLQPQSLSINLSNAIKSSEIIWQSKACSRNAVVRSSTEVVVKIVPNIDD